MSLRQREIAFTQTRAKFAARPFAWGEVDCVRLVAFHLRQMGYRPQLAKAGSYRSLRGAMTALKRTGFADLPAALDALALPRIPPAAAVIGDLLTLPGEGGLHALQIVAGNGRVFGFHAESETACFIQPRLADAMAWRVDPK